MTIFFCAIFNVPGFGAPQNVIIRTWKYTENLVKNDFQVSFDGVIHGWFVGRFWASRPSQYRWWCSVWCGQGNDIITSSMCLWWWSLWELQCSCTDPRRLLLTTTSPIVTLLAWENVFLWVFIITYWTYSVCHGIINKTNSTFISVWYICMCVYIRLALIFTLYLIKNW